MHRELMAYAGARFALLLLLLIVSLSPVFAARTACSPPVGTTALLRAQQGFSDHRPMTCTAEGETACAGRWVDDAGFWRVCNPWVPPGGDPDMRQPEPGCAAGHTYHHWGGDDDQLCTSVPPGAVIRGAEMLMLPETAHGRERVIRDAFGPATGVQVWRCESGAWRRMFQHCSVEAAAPTPRPASGGARQGDAKVGPIQIRTEPRTKLR